MSGLPSARSKFSCVLRRLTDDQFVDFFHFSAAERFGLIVGNTLIDLAGLSFILCLKNDEVSMRIGQFVVCDQCLVSCPLAFESERLS